VAMPDVEKSKYFYRGHSQNWKTSKFPILTPCTRVQAYWHQTYILYFQKRFQQLWQMPQMCPCQRQNPLAQTVYPLQGCKVDPNFENQKKIFFRKRFLLASTTARKICWIHCWNPFSNPLTIDGDICNFVLAVSGLSNSSQCSVYK